MNNKKVSVIVCNYNHHKYIDEAVESIEKQTYIDNIELVIVDDGSDKADKQVLFDKFNEYKKRGHKTIILPENKGKWYALNYAIENVCTGKLITSMDADDCSCPQRIERQVDCLELMGSFHNLCGFQSVIDDEQVMKFAVGWKSSKEDIDDADIMEHYQATQFVHKGLMTPGINHYYTGNLVASCGASSMFYKQHWEIGFRFNPPGLGLRILNSEDSDHNARLTLGLQRTSILNEPLYCYRRGTSTNNEAK